MKASVVTPSLNKSFKFQSDWPYNNSQVYLLNSIIDDLKTDEDREFKVKKDGYLFTSTVNYPNNKTLVKQHVLVDKKGKITKVEVVDKSDNVQIAMKFSKQELNKKFSKDDFALSSLLKMNSKKETPKVDSNTEKKNQTNSSTTTDSNQQNNTNNSSTENSNNNSTTNNNTNNSSTENSNNNSTTNNNTNNNSNQTTTEESKKEATTAKINDVIYPMYLPDNTYLTGQDTVKTKDGSRLILTFGGDKSFVLVEETASTPDTLEVIPVSGNFDFLSDVIGVIGNKSLSWHSNGIDYYMTSDTLEVSELVNIARSVSVLPVSK
ncbi:MAG: hypothetical protein SO108_05500 [Bacilli bacterium]|nr:hypothetical protein [Bacilli bacterium]